MTSPPRVTKEKKLGEMTDCVGKMNVCLFFRFQRKHTHKLTHTQRFLSILYANILCQYHTSIYFLLHHPISSFITSLLSFSVYPLSSFSFTMERPDSPKNSTQPTSKETVIKIVFVGEPNTGKSQIIKKYLNLEHISKPTVFDSYRVVYTPGDNSSTPNSTDVLLNICDTTGTEEMQRLIKMSYLDADVFILCIESHNLKDNLYYQSIIKELRVANRPIILAVTKCDKTLAKKNKKSEIVAQENMINPDLAAHDVITGGPNTQSNTNTSNTNTSNTTNNDSLITASMVTSNMDVVKKNAYEMVTNYSLTSYILVSVKRKKSVTALFDEAVRVHRESREEEIDEGCCCNVFKRCM